MVTHPRTSALLGQRVPVDVLALPAPGKGHDAWHVDDRALVVADGATPLGDDPGVAAFAAAVVRHLADRVHLGLREAFASVVGDLARPGHDDHPSCAVALARARGDLLEVAVLGDCVVVVATHDGGVIVTHDDRVTRFDRIVTDRLAGLLDKGVSPADAMRRIRPQLVAHRRLLNTLGGYWALADDPACADEIVVDRVARRDVAAVLLSTDGLAPLWDAFGVVRAPSELVSLVRAHGLAHVGRLLRDLERRPDSMRRHPRLSAHDDATALLVDRHAQPVEAGICRA